MAHRRLADEPLTVGDMFCGAGGFSEGFEQAGFVVKWGVDIWQPAVDTFQKNHPLARAVLADALTLEPGQLEPVDVLVGSPPCVHFSPANRGGGGDREQGMLLVRRFLDIVRALRPKFWVMENVPAMLPDLEREMVGDIYSHPEEGWTLPIPARRVIDAAEFGVPQTRKRLFSGSFPGPTPSCSYADKTVLTMGTILAALPDPSVARGDSVVPDPVYPTWSATAPSLRDHFEDTRWRLTDSDLEAARHAKEDNPVYGRMAFPDRVDRPSRTITATRTRGSRGTIVVPGRRGLRTLTLRECASAQGFPLTYQFWAKRVGDKDFLIGNAVCPPVAYSIARAIQKEIGGGITNHPRLRSPVELAPEVEIGKRGKKQFTLRRRFRGITPIDWRHDHRVELDNQPPKIRIKLPEYCVPPIIWRCRLYLGYATRYRCYEVKLADALRLARRVASASDPIVPPESLSAMILSAARVALNGFPDGNALQFEWAGLSPTKYGPRWVLSRVAHEVSDWFPAAKWSGVTIPTQLTGDILVACEGPKGTAAAPGQPLEMSARLLASAVVLSVFCERLNSGDAKLERLLQALLSTRGLASRRLDPLLEKPGSSAGPARHQGRFILGVA